MKRVYLDYAATTPLDPLVLEVMKPYFSKKYGNAASIHTFGQEAAEAVERARDVILKKLNASSKEYQLVFTSGGTESNNLAIKGVAFAGLSNQRKKHIVISAIEHDCIIKSSTWLQKIGFDVTVFPVDKEGFVDPTEIGKAIKDNTVLVSVMHANNEIGTIEPIEEILEICKEKGVYFHSDACQSFTKVPIDLKRNPVDLLTINAHKIYGPKGIGALVVRKDVKIDALLHGGGQEAGLRSGTLNVPGIVGFGKAVELVTKSDISCMKKIRDYLVKQVLGTIDDVVLNGPSVESGKRLCNNANFTFKYIEGEALVLMLDAAGVAVSTGSACSSKSLEPSHVLLAIGKSPEEAHGSLRITVGKQTSKADIDYTVEVLKKAVAKLRRISPLGK